MLIFNINVSLHNYTTSVLKNKEILFRFKNRKVSHKKNIKKPYLYCITKFKYIMLQVFIVVKGRYYKIIRLAHFARRMIMINEQAALLI